MAFFFADFPNTNYDILGNGATQIVKNPFLRYKILDVLKNRTALYYQYSVKEGQSAEAIAEKYYGDGSLDWVIYIVNDIIDPQESWPLDYNVFVKFIRSKYGSVSAAKSQTHHYEQIIQNQAVLSNGTIIPKKTVQVDLTTFNSLLPAERREVDAYTYEEELNDSKREVRVLHVDFLPQFLDEVQQILKR